MKHQKMGKKYSGLDFTFSLKYSRNETRGMTSKALTNLLKLSPIYACGRQVVKLMEDESEEMINFEVSGEDVKAAWELISISMFTYQKFKV